MEKKLNQNIDYYNYKYKYDKNVFKKHILINKFKLDD